MCVQRGRRFAHCEYAGTDSLSVMQFLQLPSCAIRCDVCQKGRKALPPSAITLAHSPMPWKQQYCKNHNPVDVLLMFVLMQFLSVPENLCCLAMGIIGGICPGNEGGSLK